MESCAGIADPRAARASEAVELRAILRQLPEGQQEVFILHHLEGYRCEEIAAALGLSVSNVKFRLFRARKLLRRMLAEEGTEL
jgi:RNA polymerase sigma-70 factor (ECF subfamily)